MKLKIKSLIKRQSALIEAFEMKLKDNRKIETITKMFLAKNKYDNRRSASTRKHHAYP